MAKLSLLLLRNHPFQAFANASVAGVWIALVPFVLRALFDRALDGYDKSMQQEKPNANKTQHRIQSMYMYLL
jgi:hypothetical protein